MEKHTHNFHPGPSSILSQISSSTPKPECIAGFNIALVPLFLNEHAANGPNSTLTSPHDPTSAGEHFSLLSDSQARQINRMELDP